MHVVYILLLDSTALSLLEASPVTFFSCFMVWPILSISSFSSNCLGLEGKIASQTLWPTFKRIKWVHGWTMKIFNFWLMDWCYNIRKKVGSGHRIAFTSVCRDGLYAYGGLKREYKNHSEENPTTIHTPWSRTKNVFHLQPSPPV